MKIGNFGKKLVFVTSDKKILTFNDFTQKVSGSWTEHKRIGKKPKKEFTGANARSISFKIVLDATLGVKPKEMLATLEKMVENGTVEYLVIGGKAIGKNRFVITEISETWDIIYNGGELARATVSITMEEYL